MSSRIRVWVALLALVVAPVALAGDVGNPLDTAPAQNPLDEARNPLDQNPAPAAQAAPHAALKLSVHRFQDISMGGVVSHTVLLPEGWRGEGFTEWSYQPIAYPQQKMSIISPLKGKVSYYPTIWGSYTEAKPVAGFPPLPPSGNPAPQDIGAWVLSLYQQYAKESSDFVLVDNRPDLAAEATARLVNAELKDVTLPSQRTTEYRIVTLAYTHKGERYREEIPLTYAREAPYENENIRSQTWMVAINCTISAPEAIFDKHKPELVSVAGTLRPTAKWWTQVQLTLMELTRLRAEQFAQAIQERAKLYDSMSRQQQAQFDQHMSSMDKVQDERVKLVYEKTDYQDVDGSKVRLPSHYHHVYTDGKGNYVLTNNTQHKPGETWTELNSVP